MVARYFDSADSLYAQAHQADTTWTEPLIGRAAVAYRRSRLVGFDGVAAKPWIEQGKKFADQALALDSQDPDAMEMRGTLRYWGWLLNLEPDPAASKQLLNAAQADLEAAVRIRPSQAGAWAILSHLYNNTRGQTTPSWRGNGHTRRMPTSAAPDQVLNRLFIASYDLGQFAEAAHWCEEGRPPVPTAISTSPSASCGC